MAAVDGSVAGSEVAQLAAMMQAMLDTRDRRGPIDLDATLIDLSRRLERDGWTARLDDVARRLRNEESRSFAFRLAGRRRVRRRSRGPRRGRRDRCAGRGSQPLARRLPADPERSARHALRVSGAAQAFWRRKRIFNPPRGRSVTTGSGSTRADEASSRRNFCTMRARTICASINANPIPMH